MGEGGARGAALFGGCAAGLFTGPEPSPRPGTGRGSMQPGRTRQVRRFQVGEEPRVRMRS